MPKPTQPTRFIKACRQEPVDRIPAWLMRQAGRYQPEYIALKERAGGFMNLCRTPEHIAEATLFAQRSLDADAAIIFSDITLPAWAMGLKLEFSPGPTFAHPVRGRKEIRALKEITPHTDLDFVMEGIAQTRLGLPDDISLIGFVGAPLTLAAYMIEGAPTRNWIELKRLAYGEPDILEELLLRVTDAVVAHATAQVEAGCDAIQLFDTCAGELAASELHRFAFDFARRVIERLQPLGVPVIYFARNIGAYLEQAAQLGAHVLGIDWTVTLAQARQRVGDAQTLMGNVDPTILFCPKERIASHVRDVLFQAKDAPGYIFNLGHGVLPKTPPSHARHMIDVVHAFSD